MKQKDACPQCGGPKTVAAEVCKKCCMLSLIGEGNPNYRNGLHCGPSVCSCGREKDYRSRKCAICSKTGFSKASCAATRLNRSERERLVSDDEMAKAVARNLTYLFAARELGVSRQSVKRSCIRLGLSTDHFLPGRGRSLPDERVFELHINRWGRLLQTRRRFEERTKDSYFCRICGLEPTWQGKMLTLSMDHINGNPLDDRIENLRWLCPNCHSQQETSYNKKREKSMSKRKELVQV